MKKLLSASLVTACTLVGSASVAGAENQPGRGERSTIVRNDAGFGGGPHCHVVVANEGSAPFTIAVVPSHTGHAHAGNAVLQADPDCDGDAGI